MFNANVISIALFWTWWMLPVQSEDCFVSVTGPHQPWTVSRGMHWKGSTPPSAQQSFTSLSPGRGESVFSVMSKAGSALQLRLFSSNGPGGYLITVSPREWHVERTFVGSGTLIMSSSPSSDAAGTSLSGISGEAWVSYMLTVRGAEQLELERLWDNGTSRTILSVSDPKPLFVERVSMRVLEVDDNGIEVTSKRRGNAVWSFWKYDCAPYFRQREPLCHIWPSWGGQVPRHFDLPSVRINPSTSISVHVQTSGITDVLLYETKDRYYQITLARWALTLSKRTFGRTEEVARTCLNLAAEPGRFRLIWVSILVGFIQVGLDEPADVNRTCVEDITTALPTVVLSTDDPTITTDTRGSLSGAESQFGNFNELKSNAILDHKEADVHAKRPSLRNTFLRWRDTEALFVLFYGVRSRKAPGLWTVDCMPKSDYTERRNVAKKATLNKTRQKTLRTNLHSGQANSESEDFPSTRSPRPPSPPPYLIALVVLSVVSVLLLLLSAILVSDIIGRRRRQTAHLDHDRRVSMAGEQQLGSAMGHEYAELLYSDLRPMSVTPGESTFKPIRRQETPALPRRSLTPPNLPPPPEDM